MVRLGILSYGDLHVPSRSEHVSSTCFCQVVVARSCVTLDKENTTRELQSLSRSACSSTCFCLAVLALGHVTIDKQARRHQRLMHMPTVLAPSRKRAGTSGEHACTALHVYNNVSAKAVAK